MEVGCKGKKERRGELEEKQNETNLEAKHVITKCIRMAVLSILPKAIV